MRENNHNKSYSLLTIVLMACIVLLLVFIGFLINRINVVAPPGPPLAGPPLAPPPGIVLKTVKGTLKGYVHNVHLDINGVQIEREGEGLLTFEFRPHTAGAVLSVAGHGQQVEIGYDTRPNDESIVYQLHTIENIASKKRIDVEQLPPPPRIPPGQQTQLFKIENPQIVTDSYGGVAALQAPGRLFHFKPEQVEEIQSIIKNGHHFTLLAVNRGDDQGFINIHHDRVYIVISITIDSKTFMIR